MHDEPIASRKSQLRLRSVERREYSASATLRRPEGVATPILIENISPLGLRFWSNAPVEVGTLVEIRIGRRKPFSALVKWNDGNRYGCQFMRRKRGKPFEVPGGPTDRAARLDTLLRGWAKRKPE